jgi:hypothetical protein
MHNSPAFSMDDLARLIEGYPRQHYSMLDGAGPCSLNGNIVTTGDDFDAWRYTLKRTVRKELERSWRVFTREPAAAFKIVAEKNEALRILATMEAQRAPECSTSG